MFRSITPLILGGVLGAATISAVWLVQSGRLERKLVLTPVANIADGPGLVSDSSLSSIPPQPSESEALDMLADVESPAEIRALSLELLDVFGYSLGGIQRIADGLPAADRLNFTFDAIVRIAVSDPRSAIRMALGLDDFPAKSEAIRRIARALTGIDPRSALAHGVTIANYDLGDEFRSAVFETWADNDPAGFLAFVESAQPAEIRASADAFAIAATIQPEYLLAMLDRIPQSARLTAQRAALEVLVKRDTGAALAHLQALPAGSARDSLYRSTAESYAEHNLEEALAWADSLQPPSDSAMNGVLWVLAKSDPVRGVDVFINRLQTGSGPNAGFDANLILQAFTPGPTELMSIVAQRLSSVDDAGIKTMFDSFMNDWAGNDPEGAFEWALANPGQQTGSSLLYVARNLASASPKLAMQATARVPPDMQDGWIRIVAGELGRGNFDTALQWISRYQGQSVYADALGAVLEAVALRSDVEDPALLARLLDGQPAEVRANSVAVVANAWAEQDPAAAARWVERIELTDATEQRRQPAFSNVAARWAAQDVAAAEDWVLGLEQGAARDSALGSLLSVTSAAGRVNTQLLEAFSSEERGQRSLASMMVGLGRSDPDLGRELMDRYISDPALRAEAEQRLVQGMSGTGLQLGNVVSLR
jgi:hypothetical protein